MKILLFSWGDPSLKTTWSNVPYCLASGLQDNGHNVVGINLENNPRFANYWDKNILRYLRKVFRGCQYSYMRTLTARYFAERIIKKAIRQNPDADLCLFTTFSFSAKNNRIPSMLFCDWSYESYLDRINHKPYFFEKWFIANERRCIRSAAACVSMFPDAAEKMNKQLGLKKTIWGGVQCPKYIRHPAV